MELCDVNRSNKVKQYIFMEKEVRTKFVNLKMLIWPNI